MDHLKELHVWTISCFSGSAEGIATLICAKQPISLIWKDKSLLNAFNQQCSFLKFC